MLLRNQLQYMYVALSKKCHWGKVTLLSLLENLESSFNYPSLTVFVSLSALRHPNLVRLIGITLDKPPIYFITEYMAKVT